MLREEHQSDVKQIDPPLELITASIWECQSWSNFQTWICEIVQHNNSRKCELCFKVLLKRTRLVRLPWFHKAVFFSWIWHLPYNMFHTPKCPWPGRWIPALSLLFSASQSLHMLEGWGKRSSLIEDRHGKCDWSWNEGTPWLCQVTGEQPTKLLLPVPVCSLCKRLSYSLSSSFNKIRCLLTWHSARTYLPKWCHCNDVWNF